MDPHSKGGVKRILKTALRTLLFRPHGVNLGQRSYIKRPYLIPMTRGITIGSDSLILAGCHLELINTYAGRSYYPRLEIGNGVYIGSHFFATTMNSISIGDCCVVSDNVYISDASHGLIPGAGPIMLQELTSKGPVHIGQNCFLGYRSAILPGVTLGESCIVGVGSVVTRSFPAFSMLVGAPAQRIRTFDHATKSWIVVGPGNTSV